MNWNTITETPVPSVGDVIFVDTWKQGSYHASAKLEECEWDGAQFYVTTEITRVTLAIRLRITGRTYQWPLGAGSPQCVRVEIEFVGDGEPSTYTKGWLRTRNW